MVVSAIIISTISVDFSDTDEVLKSIDDIHKVGTFVKIHEMQLIEDKMVLVVMGHRR